MTSFYLAARMSEAPIMREHAEDLARIGIECTAQWIFDSSEDNAAERDIADIRRAGGLIEFPSPSTHRGHAWECGFAHGIGKDIFIVGEPGCIFDSLFAVFPDWQSLLQTLRPSLRNVWAP